MGRLRNSWFITWWRGVKPTDVLTVVVTTASVAIAVVALDKANQATTDQENLSAPVLAPGAPFDQRGLLATVVTDFETFHKRADLLLLERPAPTTPAHLVIPLRNGGAGIAFAVGLPVLVADCVTEPNLLPKRAVGLLGTYVVPAGGSDQLGYAQPNASDHPSGAVTSSGQSLWFNFEYAAFGPTADPLAQPRATKTAKLLVWYTDGALRRLDWTCIDYLRRTQNTDGSPEYAVYGEHYGSRAWPGGPPPH